MRRKILNNFISLSSIQIANYIFPFLSLPYLVKVIGVEKFGLIAFAQAVITYFQAFSMYGFDLFGARAIAISRDHSEAKRVFWAIMFARFLLFFISAIVFMSLFFIVPNFRAEWIVFLGSFLFIFGDILFPVWFFQGVQKMFNISLLNLAAKVIYTACIFMFIKSADKYYLVALFYSASQLLIGILAICIIIFRYKFYIIRVRKKEVFAVLGQAKYLFLSSVSINFYLKLPAVMLGFISGNASVAYYSAAEKIYYALRRIQQSFTQALFPHVSKLASESNAGDVFKFVAKVLKLSLLIVIPVSLISFIFSKQLIYHIYSPAFYPSVAILQLFSLLFVFISINDAFGIQAMLSLGFFREYGTITIVAVVINAVCLLVLLPEFTHFGAGISLVITQFSISVMMILFLIRKGFKFLKC